MRTILVKFELRAYNQGLVFRKSTDASRRESIGRWFEPHVNQFSPYKNMI